MTILVSLKYGAAHWNGLIETATVEIDAPRWEKLAKVAERSDNLVTLDGHASHINFVSGK